MKLPSLTPHYEKTPNLEEILSRVPIDETHLNRLSLQDNGPVLAEKYGEALFEAQYGDEIQMAALRAENLQTIINEKSGELESARDRRDSIERTHPLADSEKTKVPMPTDVIAIQWVLAVGVIFLLAIGVNNFASLIVKIGEPYLTSPWLAYAFALAGSLFLAIIQKCFISVFKHEQTQQILAVGFLGIGFLASLIYLAIISNIVNPELREVSMESLIPSLHESNAISHQIVTENWFSTSGSRWMLFFQLIAESSGAAGLAYFYVRNDKDYRRANARKNDAFLEAEKDVEKVTASLREENEQLAQNEGFLRVMGHARNLICGKCRDHVIAAQRVIQVVFTTTNIKFK